MNVTKDLKDSTRDWKKLTRGWKDVTIIQDVERM